jgi:hypothetical protein
MLFSEHPKGSGFSFLRLAGQRIFRDELPCHVINRGNCRADILLSSAVSVVPVRLPLRHTKVKKTSTTVQSPGTARMLI